MTVTDDYMLDRARLAGTGAKVLDLGCGDGRFVEVLSNAGFDAYGVDVPSALPGVELRLADRPDLRSRIVFLDDAEKIPLPDNSVDMILSNNVFEHIPTLSSTVREMARILKPGGIVYAVFPLRSAIIEGHAHLPFFHRIKSRAWRLRYANLMKSIGLYHCPMPPAAIEKYVAVHCFYRSKSEIDAIFSNCFSSVESDARAYIEIKAKSLKGANGWFRRQLGDVLLRGGAALLAPIVHTHHSAAYRLSGSVGRTQS